MTNQDFIKRKKQLIKDVHFDYESMHSLTMIVCIVEDVDEFEVKKLLKESENIDSLSEAQKYEDWVALNNANKKLLSYKIHNMRKNFSNEFNEIVSKYLDLQ